jgi:hypothetical protein
MTRVYGLAVAMGLTVGLATGCKPKAAVKPDASPPPSPKQEAWTLGHQMALAALGNAAGVTGGVVERSFAKAKEAAQGLGTELPPLPTPEGDEASKDADALGYLLEDPGKKIEEYLSDKYGDDERALFDLAIKAESLYMIYFPGDDLGTAAATAIEHDATIAGVPDPLWKPLVAKIHDGATFDDVTAKVDKLDDGVPAFLGVSAD